MKTPRAQRHFPRRLMLASVAGGSLSAILSRREEARGQTSAEPNPPPGLPGRFRNLANWCFGTSRADATIRNMADLRRYFRFRYIYDHGRLDGLPTYWSKHRDYPEGDPRSLHVFEPDCLVLKGRIPPGGGLHPGGIESGMLRALLPITEGMVIGMRARLPRGLGTWPAFWLSPGVEYPNGTFSATPWPPEIDIFEFFEWQGRDRPRLLEAHVQTNGDPGRYGNPVDTFSRIGPHGYDPGVDFSAGFHEFLLDWQPGLPTWYVDGVEIQQKRYLWPAPPAHILVTNQIGMTLKGVDLSGMKAEDNGWNYAVEWLRVWRRDS